MTDSSNALAHGALSSLACYWWEHVPHPCEEEHAADEFLKWLGGELQLDVIMLAGSDHSEATFAELVGWS